MIKTICLITVICFSFTSCCTLIRGTRQEVLVTSSPTGASIEIDGCDCGPTPQIFSLKRRHDHQIILSKKGYEPESYMLKSHWSPFLIDGLAPLTCAGIGAGTGLIINGGSIAGFDGVAVLGCAAAGFAVGTVLGLLSITTDFCSGSAYKLTHSEIQANLIPLSY